MSISISITVSSRIDAPTASRPRSVTARQPEMASELSCGAETAMSCRPLSPTPEQKAMSSRQSCSAHAGSAASATIPASVSPEAQRRHSAVVLPPPSTWAIHTSKPSSSSSLRSASMAAMIWEERWSGR